MNVQIPVVDRGARSISVATCVYDLVSENNL